MLWIILVNELLHEQMTHHISPDPSAHDAEAVFRKVVVLMDLSVGPTSKSEQQWSSGRIHRCHRCDPGSIPGSCIFFAAEITNTQFPIVGRFVWIIEIS